MTPFVRLARFACLGTSLAAVWAGTAQAHGGGSFSVAPHYNGAGHSSAAHGNGSMMGFMRSMFEYGRGTPQLRPVLYSTLYVQSPNGAYSYLGGTAPLVLSPSATQVSEAQRYRTATGQSLPLRHGNICLPPSTPNGDVTYVWATSDGD